MQDSDNTFVFFKPSAKLTDEIIKQNQALVKEYTARTAPEEPTETADYEPDLGWFGLGRPRSMKPTLVSPVEAGQEVIAERIYNYLSSLSESPWAVEGGTFPVSEYLPSGMMTMLGFSSLRKQPNSARAKNVWRLVERLTEEFVDWLANEQNAAFVTPWLEMHLTTEGELLLIAIPEKEGDDPTRDVNDLSSVGDMRVTEANGAVVANDTRTNVSTESVPPNNSPAVITDVKREIDAFVTALEAGKKAYHEARLQNGLEAEETSLTAEEDFGVSESQQDRPFTTASAAAEDKTGQRP